MGKKENDPIVSVIVATYNRALCIKKAIESVLNQTYKNIEIIVIDDGSTDNTKKILEPYIRTKKIKYIYQKNTGSLNARDNGIKNSQGKYIAILDSDDIWCDQNKLKKQVEFLENHSDYVLCGGGVIITNEKGKEIVKFLDPEQDEDIRKSILFLSNFVHSSVVFRGKAFFLVGGYDEKLNYSGDRDLWLKLGKVGKFYNFQDYFVNYLQGKQNRTNKQWREITKVGDSLRKKYRDDYPNYYQAVLFSWLYFFYNFLFIRKLLYPISPKLRKLVFNISNFLSKFPSGKNK